MVSSVGFLNLKSGSIDKDGKKNISTSHVQGDIQQENLTPEGSNKSYMQCAVRFANNAKIIDNANLPQKSRTLAAEMGISCRRCTFR